MKLKIYENGTNKSYLLISDKSTKRLYYTAMRLIRWYRHKTGHVPYMECDDKKLNWLITCKRVNINTKYWKEYTEC